GLTACQFIGDASADFAQGFHHLQAHYGPIGLFLVAFEILAQEPGALAGGGHLTAQIRKVEDLLDVPQAVGPGTIIAAGDGPASPGSFIVQEAVKISEPSAPPVSSAAAGVGSAGGEGRGSRSGGAGVRAGSV